MLTTLDIIPDPPNLFMFTHEHELQYVLNEGPWSIYGQILLLQCLKIGMKPHQLTFDSYRIWMKFDGLPFMRRNKEDLRILLKDFFPINAIKPNKHYPIPAEGIKIQHFVSP